MISFRGLALSIAIAAATLLVGVGRPIAQFRLQLEAKISLGEVRGRIDHMAIDLARQRLFVAELGNDTVGIVDLKNRERSFERWGTAMLTREHHGDVFLGAIVEGPGKWTVRPVGEVFYEKEFGQFETMFRPRRIDLASQRGSRRRCRSAPCDLECSAG